MKLIPTTNTNLIKSIMLDEDLFYASMMDIDIKNFEEGNWEPSPNFTYLLAKEGSDAVGLVRLHDFTPVAIDVHFSILPKYWGTGVSNKVQKTLEHWLIDNTPYIKIITQTPRACEEVIKAQLRNGYQIDVALPNTTLWRNKVEDLVIMSKYIRGFQHG